MEADSKQIEYGVHVLYARTFQGFAEMFGEIVSKCFPPSPRQHADYVHPKLAAGNLLSGGNCLRVRPERDIKLR